MRTCTKCHGCLQKRQFVNRLLVDAGRLYYTAFKTAAAHRPPYVYTTIKPYLIASNRLCIKASYCEPT